MPKSREFSAVIAVVDDDPSVRKGLARRFRTPGSALVAACLALAFSALSAAPPDVQFVEVPITTGAKLQFFHVPWESPRFAVRKIVQDDKGFLWLGAADGLRRYDGYGFLRVPGDYERSSIGFIISESLIKDHSGALWFGDEDFLDRYDPETGDLRRYLPNGSPCGPPGLHQISEDKEGFLWLAMYDGLIHLNPATSRLSCYQHRQGDDATIAANLVISTIESRDGTLWVATDGALEAFDRHSGKVTRRISFKAASGARLSLAGFFANLYEDRAGVLWTGLSSGGDLASVDPKTGRITAYSFRAPGSRKNAPSGVVSIVEDQDGALWLGTSALGLLKLERDRNRVLWYQSNPDDPNSLSRDLVVGLFQDREGSFWALTRSGDAYRFDPRPPVFRSYRHQPENPNSLIDDSVLSAYQDSRGILWVGTEGGLNRIDQITGQVKRYERGAFASGVRSIAEDRHGYLWFGTRGNGLVRFNVRTGASRTHRYISSDPKSLSNDYVGALWVNRQGVLWAGTDYGINRYVEETGQFQRFSPPGESLTRYHSIAEEPDGPLWLASSQFGLDRFDPRTGKFTQYRHNPGDERSVSHNRVYSVYADHSGTIWAATFRGLDRFNPADHSFTHYDARNGLPANTVLGILEDDGGYLWITTTDGLGRFDPRTATCTNYHTADGLPSDLFSVLVTASKSRAGEMYFGSSNSGLLAFFADRVIDRLSAPPVVLTDFRWFGEAVPVKKGLLKQPIWSTRSLSLPERSIFSFEFSALNYTDPSRTRYRYRLEGLETKWNETESTRRVASYTTLSPGNYTFRVQARRDRGDWSAEGLALPIRILPLWYDTWWFRSVFAATVLILLWAAYRFRIGQLKRLRQLEADLAHINRVSMMGELSASIAHEVNQPLTGIVSNGSACLRFLAGDAPNLEEAREAVLDIVRDGKRAGEVIARIRALTKRTALPKEKLDVNETIQEVLTLVGDQAKKNSVVVRTRFADEICPVLADRVQLQQVLLNLVMNGIEAMSSVDDRERQLLIITRNIDLAQVQVTVEDSGTGLDPSIMSKIFEPFYTTKSNGMGMGLSISHSIVQNHGGRLWATANEGFGSSLHFTLPRFQGEEGNAGVAGA